MSCLEMTVSFEPQSTQHEGRFITLFGGSCMSNKTLRLQAQTGEMSQLKGPVSLNNEHVSSHHHQKIRKTCIISRRDDKKCCHHSELLQRAPLLVSSKT